MQYVTPSLPLGDVVIEPKDIGIALIAMIVRARRNLYLRVPRPDVCARWLKVRPARHWLLSRGIT